MLTGLAITPGGSARRIVQYEVAKVNLPPIPAALTLSGPLNPALIGFPNSNNYVIDGHNGTDPITGAACPGGDKPAVGTMTDVGKTLPVPETATQVATDNRNTIINALARPDHYTGAEGCTPDVQNVMGTVNSDFTTVSGLNKVVHEIQGAATQTYGNNPSISNLGTDANPQVIVVNGDLSLSGKTSGAGILLVTGTLNLSGNFSWDGLILVIGAGVMNPNGGGNGQINGAIVIANIGNSNYPTNPTDANLLPNLGTPTFLWNGGGGNGIKYNSCDLNLAAAAANYTVIARREITY